MRFVPLAAAAVMAASVLVPASLAAQSKWKVQHTTSLLLGVDAVDSMHAWVGGGMNGLGATIHGTSDGGKTWTKLYGGLDFTGMVMDIDMVDSQVGYAGGLGLPGMSGLGKTTDGGKTWTKLTPVLRAFLANAWQDVFALDRNHVWVVGTWVGLGAGEGVSSSSDGGKTWTFVDTTTTVGTSARYCWFVDPKNGWLASGQWPSQNNPNQPYLGVISKTTDGGLTWTNQFKLNGFYFNSIQFVDANHGWVTADGPGSSGRVYHTSDGGKTWKNQPFPNQDKTSLTGISMLDRKNGWAVGFGAGAGGQPAVNLIQTTDGKTWRLDPFKAPYGPLVISMVNPGRGWTVGSNNFQAGGIMMLDAEELGNYGGATAGCGLWLSGVGRPLAGNQSFGVRVTSAPGQGALLIGGAPTSQSLLGIELLVDPTGIEAIPMSGSLGMPIPNRKGLIGRSAFTQAVYLARCGPQGLAATQGLVITVR